MEWQGMVSLGLTLGTLLILIFTRISAHWVMMGALVILSALGILTAGEAFAGFSNAGMITVAAMFVVAAGIHASGGVELIVRYVLRNPKGVRAAQFRLCLPIIAFGAFLNNTPVVATMIPAVRAWSKRIDVAPSKLMIPLSYAAMLGGTVTLIGTSTNLIVDGQYQAITGNPGFSLFSITAVGLPVAIVGLIFMLWAFPRLLPDRREEMFGNLREFTLEVAIAADGPLVGQTVAQAGLRDLKRIYLVEIERDGAIIPAVDSAEILRAGDRLVFAGDVEAISDLLRIKGIVPSTGQAEPTLAQEHHERRLVEAVLSHHSHCINQTVHDSQFRERYGAVVLAVARNGERIAGNLGSIVLMPGDTLLLEARPAFVSRQRYNKDFLLINDLETEAPRHQRAWVSWVILLVIILAAGFGLTSMLNAALLGAAAMILTGCCSPQQAQKSLDPTVLLTIASSFALGAALHKTGVAQFLAENVVAMSGGRPWLLLLLTYVMVSMLTEVITNNAAAMLTLPVVLEMTQKASLNPESFVFAVMMAASASFATPVSYQTNLMVYGPGGYRFTDFLRAGIPMNLVVGSTTVIILLLGWPLTLAG